MLQNSLDSVSQRRWTMTEAYCDGITVGKKPQEQAETEDSCSKCRAEHHQERNPASGDIYGLQISGNY